MKIKKKFENVAKLIQYLYRNLNKQWSNNNAAIYYELL